MRRMLPVGVHPPAVRVVVLERPPIAGGDAEPQAQVRPERVNLGAVLARDLGRAIRRPVVDDEHVGVGKLRVQRVEHGGQIVLLVPRGDEDDGVVHGTLELRSGRPQLPAHDGERTELPRDGTGGREDRGEPKPDRDAVRPVDAAEDPARPEEMQRRADHDRLRHAALEQERQRARGVLRRRRCGLLGDELERRAVPERCASARPRTARCREPSR